MAFLPLSRAAADGWKDFDWSKLDVSKLPPPAPVENVTYLKEIRPLLETSCFRCHGEKRKRGDLRLDSLEAALKGGESGKVIIPGESAKSPLVIAVARIDEGTAMPPMRKAERASGRGDATGEKPPNPPGAGGPGPQGAPGAGPAKALTSEEVGLLRAWIDQGAK